MATLITEQQAMDICDIGKAGREIIDGTAFKSQDSYNHRRGVRVANIINDYFCAADFKDRRILELGPGHYAFSLLARELGATVVCIEKDPHFIDLGRHLGFEVIDKDFRHLEIGDFPGLFDGLWVKGTFNACNFDADEEVGRFARTISDLVGSWGWRWLAVVNKGPDQELTRHRIQVQRRALENLEWGAISIADEERPKYSLKYTGSPFLYVHNLPKYADRVEPRLIDGAEAAWDRPFNKVQRTWKPTREYYPSPWQYYKDFIDILKRREVEFVTMSEALSANQDPPATSVKVILDHHLDYYPLETEVMCKWERENGVRSSVYLFNRANYIDTQQKKMWNLDDLNVPLYQELEQGGFEIGYHQNAVGQLRANQGDNRSYSKSISDDEIEEVGRIFARDIEGLRRYFSIKTLIPHGAGEGNSNFVDWPDGFEDVTWAYNNRRQAGSDGHDVKWRNFSDSPGCSAQYMRGCQAQFVVRIDNLHVRAHTLDRGLNHILLHPGRYGRGMPYGEYIDNSNDFDLSESFEFKVKGEALPVTAYQMLRDKRVGLRVDPGDSRRAERDEIGESKYGFFDEPSDMRVAMAEAPTLIPFFVVHRKMTADEREACRVTRPINVEFKVPVRGAESKKRFLEEYASFYNSMYSRNALKTLSETTFPISKIVWRQTVTWSGDLVECLDSVIARLVEGAEVSIRLGVPGRSRTDAYRMIADLLTGVPGIACKWVGLPGLPIKIGPFGRRITTLHVYGRRQEREVG